jgi:phosphoglucomutase
MKKYGEWLNSDYVDEQDKIELKAIENNPKEIEDRFYIDLAFGTAGMRGVRGIGSNRINKYMIRKATQGLANYIIEASGEEGKRKGVVIAHDSRIGSPEYALNAALVLAANGIKAYLFKGVRSTPELSFAVRELGAEAGIVVTASHNPAEYNGYKVYWNDGGQIVDPQAKGIVKAVEEVEDFSQIKMISEEKAREEGLFVTPGKEVDDAFIANVKSQTLREEIPGKSEFKIAYTPLHGTGAIPVQRALGEMGFDALYTVEEQEKPDGNFPTCAYANPEDSAAFEYVIKLADKIGAKIAMANDPDADRTGIAVKDRDGNWIYPNGNQVGLLLMNYILENRKEIPANGAVISTIVSTPMLDVVAKDKGVNIFRTLTGFKYIGEKIREFESGKLDGTYLFGFEESYGYLIGTHARDKDAIVTTLLLAEMAAYYDSIGTSIPEMLEKLYDKYGWYKEGVMSITKKGKSGLEEIQAIMEKFRNMDHTTLLGKKVVAYKDYEKSEETGLPKANVVQFILEDGTYITVRPSGTEPKIKYYFCVVENDKQKAEEKLTKTMEEIAKI